MIAVDTLRDALPELAKDIKLNLQAVLSPGALTPEQRWGVAVASAAASHNERLTQAVLSDARAEVPEPVIEDALAAAVLMGMNNIYYRFRHLVGKASYADKPARLRMNRIVKPVAAKLDFELYCLAVSAINGCESCIRSHEQVVIAGGITEDGVNDAIRIAATLQAAALALELPTLPAALVQTSAA